MSSSRSKKSRSRAKAKPATVASAAVATRPRSAPRPAPAAQRALEPAWSGPAVRGTVLAIVVAVSLGFATFVHDIYVTPKVTLLGLGTLALAGVWLWSLASSGVLRVPADPVARLVAAMVAALALATVVNGYRMISVFGEYGRGAGLLTYTAAAVAFAAVLTEFDRRSLPRLLWWVAGAGGVVVLYGGLQLLGAEPFRVPTDKLAVSTLGQVNFMGGISGVLLPLFLWLAARRAHPPATRVAGGVLAVLTIVVGSGSDSFQAYPAFGAAGLLFAAVWAYNRWGLRPVVAAVALVVMLGAAFVAVEHQHVGNQISSGLDERELMWRAASDMIQDRPVLGMGPSGFAAHFTQYRPAEHAIRFGAFSIVDVPHSVPVGMFVSGGAVLGLLYLAFVLWVGIALVQGLRRTRGDDQLLLGAAGAAWLGYQVQSVVSIDVPVLILLHFVLGAAVLVVARDAGARTITVPGMVAGWHRGRPAVAIGGRLVQVLAVAVVLAGSVFVLRPFVADAAFADAEDERASQQPEAALDDLDRATSLAGWYGNYWAIRAATLASTGDQDAALAAGIRAAEKMPSAVSYAISAAQLADRMGQQDVARKYFTYARVHGPHVSAVLNAIAAYYYEQHEYRRALPLAQEATRNNPETIDYWLQLGKIATQADEPPEAARAYEAVLKLDPSRQEALQALGRTIP